jgi:hypothetical protein
MNRLILIGSVALGLLTPPAGAYAQPAGKIPRIGTAVAIQIHLLVRDFVQEARQPVFRHLSLEAVLVGSMHEFRAAGFAPGLPAVHPPGSWPRPGSGTRPTMLRIGILDRLPRIVTAAISFTGSSISRSAPTVTFAATVYSSNPF